MNITTKDFGLLIGWMLGACTIQPLADDDTASTGADTGDTGDTDEGSVAVDTDRDESSGDDAETAPSDEDPEPGGDMATDEAEGVVDDVTDGDTDATRTDPGPDPNLGTTDEEPEPDVATPDVDRFECEVVALEDADMVVSGRLSSDATWSGIVVLEGVVEVNDVELTIEPGTLVVMAPGSSLSLSEFSDSTVLTAAGTPEAPIRFCGSVAEAGHYGQIVAHPRLSEDSVLRNVLVADGGGGVDAALVIHSPLLVENVQVSNSASAGVAAARFDDDSSALSVFDSAVAVLLTDDPAVDDFPLGGTFQGNADNRVRLTFSRLEVDSTFHDLGIPYLQEQNLELMGSVVTVAAGVEYQVATGRAITISPFVSDTVFTSDGVDGNEVVFRGAEAESGYWNGIHIDESTAPTSAFRHTRISHAGDDDQYALTITADITLDHLELTDNERGIWLGSSGLRDDSTVLSVLGTAEVPVSIHPNAWPTLPLGGTFTDNGQNFVDVREGRLERDGGIGSMPAPYRVLGEVEIIGDSELMIAAGTEFVMSLDSFISVGRYNSETSLMLNGAEDAPIRFRGEQAEPGYWFGIRLEGTVVDSSTFEWVEISDAGGGTQTTTAALTLVGPVEVHNCTFASSAGHGILKDSDDPHDYSADNTFVENAEADVGEM